MSHKDDRWGFTLLELLVVIAVMSVLIGLLLPAVQRTRETANRAKCQNNLKQIALACAHSENVNGLFPPTGSDGEGPSWAWMLLPYLEQDNLYRMWNSGTFLYDLSASTATALQTPVPVYFCPSHRDPRSESVVAGSFVQPPDLQ